MDLLNSIANLYLEEALKDKDGFLVIQQIKQPHPQGLCLCKMVNGRGDSTNCGVFCNVLDT